MARTPGPLFVDIAADQLRTYWEGRRNPKSSDPAVAGGMYLDDSRPPITPEVYRTRIEYEASRYVPNTWEQFADLLMVINSNVWTYTQYYRAALNSPLSGSAQPDVRAWYDEERMKLGLPPAPPKQIVPGEEKP